MNVFGKRERSWRKARKRGVSPIIATILLDAITVVLAAVLNVLISGLTTGGANTVPIGTTFAYGSPVQSSASQCTTSNVAGSCYAIGIQSAGSSATTGNIHFTVQSSGTAIGTAWTVYLVNSVGTTVAYYASTGTSWTAAGSFTLPQTFSSTETLVLYSGGTSGISISGDSLVAVGVGGLSGTVPVALP